MAIGKDGAVGRQLRTLFNVGSIRELADGQLLERFATGRDEAAELAFAALVERHGPMVLRVCRGVLDDPHESEDAFQATFLVLVAKGRALWVRDSLGPWLHQVAYRTASCARANAARRRRLERLAAKEEREVRREAVADLGRVLHEEINRLPERYRAPIVLCDLEGRTHEQAARHLGWPVGTVKSRQARARERLRDRLARRGFAPTSVLPAVSPKFDASLPIALLNSTTLAAVRSVASRAIVPGSAAALAQGVIRTMVITRWLKVATVLAALGAAGSGVGVGLVAQEGKSGDAPKPPVGPRAIQPDTSIVRVAPGKLSITTSGRGNLEASRGRDVVNIVEGGTTIMRIKPEGARVKEGEVVAKLDSALLRDTLTNQMITIQQAEASFKQARLVREVAEYAVKEYEQGILLQDRETYKGRIADAESNIRKDEARLERARKARQRFDEALGPNKEPATPADIAADLAIDAHLDGAERDLSKQKRDLELAKRDLEILEKYTQEKQTRKLAIDVERARADELSKLSRWELEKTKVAKLERQIKACTLLAPGDGYIVYANEPPRAGVQNPVSIEEGATVRERQRIFTVFDTADPMRINAKMPEAWVDQIARGMKARVRVDAAQDVELTGVVQSIAPMADPSFRFSNDEKVYTTIIKLDKSPLDLNLRPGLSGQAEILIAELEDVLTVPATSIIERDDKYRVAVRVPEGGIEWRELTLGRSDGKVVEVKQGLRPGDLVILDPMAQLSEKEKQEMLRKPPTAPAPPRAKAKKPNTSR